MKVYVLSHWFGGCHNEVRAFLNEQKAEEARIKLTKNSSKDEDYEDIILEELDVIE